MSHDIKHSRNKLYILTNIKLFNEVFQSENVLSSQSTKIYGSYILFPGNLNN